MVGRRIGGYRVLRLLGEGGMSAVYEAVHEQIGRRAAIKVLSERMREQPEIAARFIQEARAANQVRHPGIVAIYEYGQLPEGPAYLVMEHLDGETLEARLHRVGGRMPEALVIALGRQIAGVLAAAHAEGVVHRDVKTPNVMIVKDPDMPGGERVKVLDFGIAKVRAEAEGGPGSLRTRTGLVMGTPHYMSPEQCRGAGLVDDKADVYSLGCVLFEMAAGRTPFCAEGAGELIGQHLHVAPPHLGDVAPWTSPALGELIGRTLRKAPAERPAMTEVAAELGRLAERGTARGYARPGTAEEEAYAATAARPAVLPGSIDQLAAATAGPAGPAPPRPLQAPPPEPAWAAPQQPARASTPEPALAFDSTLDRDPPAPGLEPTIDRGAPRPAAPASPAAPPAASRPAILAAPLSMPQPSRPPAVAASALASQPALPPPTAPPGKRTTLGASAGESMAGPGPRRGRLAAALGLGLLATLGLALWQLRGRGTDAPSVAAVSGDRGGRPGAVERPEAPAAAGRDDRTAGTLAAARPAAGSAGADPRGELAQGSGGSAGADPGRELAGTDSDGEHRRPGEHRSRRGKRHLPSGAIAAASADDGDAPAGAPADRAEARHESKGSPEGLGGAAPDSKAEARRPEPRDALGRHLMAVAARVAPGLRMQGALFAERGEEGEERHRYVELTAGRCYVFVSVGSPTMEALYTYLWDPSGERVATQKEGRESVFTHCARSSGRYHFLGKAAGEAGEMRSAIFVR